MQFDWYVYHPIRYSGEILSHYKPEFHLPPLVFIPEPEPHFTGAWLFRVQEKSHLSGSLPERMSDRLAQVMFCSGDLYWFWFLPGNARGQSPARVGKYSVLLWQCERHTYGGHFREPEPFEACCNWYWARWRSCSSCVRFTILLRGATWSSLYYFVPKV